MIVVWNGERVFSLNPKPENMKYVIGKYRAQGFHTAEVDPPDNEELETWLLEGVAEAIDGCETEPDGYCPHGTPSWFLVLGMI